ncbi:MAG: guanine permease, partial [Euryarchaeota archaeon TMED255]
MIARFFKLQENQTNIRTEILAGFTTFITMGYIIFVNPQIMATAGMDYGASFVTTCLVAAIACMIMGVYANWPIGLAPGMGLNAFFTYTVVGEMGYSWQVALGAVFLAGVIFFIISVTPVRRYILESIPMNLRIAMGAGVGLFIGFIGLKNGGIVVSNQATYLAIGNFTTPETLLSGLGFLIIMVLSVRRVPGAILIGILAITSFAAGLDLIKLTDAISSPPSIAPIFLQLDIAGALNIALVSVIASFLFVNLFDTAGTLLAVASRARLVNEDGEIRDLDRALQADSGISVMGAFFGCAPVTSYVESSAGASAGGRTGLTAVVVGLLFLGSIFLSPLAAAIPSCATAGALIYVAMLMLTGMESLDWSDNSELLPALVTIFMIPMTFSIADGIASGFI